MDRLLRSVTMAALVLATYVLTVMTYWALLDAMA